MSLEKELRSITPDEASAAMENFMNKADQQYAETTGKEQREAGLGLAYVATHAYDKVHEAMPDLSVDGERALKAFIGLYMGTLMELASVREVNEALGITQRAD